MPRGKCCFSLMDAVQRLTSALQARAACRAASPAFALTCDCPALPGRPLLLELSFGPEHTGLSTAAGIPASSAEGQLVANRSTVQAALTGRLSVGSTLEQLREQLSPSACATLNWQGLVCLLQRCASQELVPSPSLAAAGELSMDCFVYFLLIAACLRASFNVISYAIS